MNDGTNRPADNPVLAGRRILVVEDEMLLALDLQMILEDQGCEVLGPVPSAKRALALLERERPDAATLDMNLNGQSSAPIAAALSEQKIPFLIISGYNNLSEEEPLLRNARHVAKPFATAILLRELTALLAE